MSKMKKVLLMCTAYVLVAALAIGGTVAYLQDTDSNVNVMTLGNVKIEQHEYQRVIDDNGTYKTDTIDGVESYVLEAFEQGKALLPATESTNFGAGPWDSTRVRMTQVDSYGTMDVFTSENAQDKFVTVENTGKTDAYVRTLVAVECGSTDATLVGTSYHTNWEKNSIGIIEIDDNNNYYLIEYIYKGASDNSRHMGGVLPAGETSYPNLSQVYIKNTATNEDCEAIDGNGNGTLDILVLSQAVQAKGFENAQTALDTAFGDITTENHPWSDEENKPVIPVMAIGSEQDLWDFAARANAGDNFSGEKVILVNDIDLGGETWTPISSFAGEFDGNGHTISNFHIEAVDAGGGFFNVIEAGSGERVHDLTLKDVTATVGNNRFGTLANYVKGIVNRVTVENVNVTTTGSSAWVGGMCAFMSWPWMNDCTVNNVVVNAESGAEFVCGFACILQKNSNMIFDNNDVNGFEVTVTDTDGSCGVAGFVGQTQRGWENPKIINTDVTGIDVTATGTVDVAGFIAWPGAHTIAENCTTEGEINVTGVTSVESFAGGFFGNLGWNCDLGQMGHVITNCSADVDITTKIAPAGGFVGSATNSYNRSMYATFNNCSASGDITAVAGASADIGGFFGDGDRGDYNNCTATGTVTNNGTGHDGKFGGALYDVTPGYDGRYPAGTRDYLVDEIFIDGCTADIGYVENDVKLTIDGDEK